MKDLPLLSHDCPPIEGGVAVRVGCIRKACRPLRDGSLVSGLHNCGRERPGGVYTAVARILERKLWLE